MIDRSWYCVKHAVRALLQNRAFSLVTVLSIGLGAGANSAIFSLVDQALVRPLPVREPERLVLLDWNGTFVGPGWGSGNLLPHPLYRDLVKDNQTRHDPVFDGLCARHPTRVHLTAGSAPEPVVAEIVSGSYFSVLGVTPAVGRLIEESDDVQPGAHPVVVLSFDYWRNRLGSPLDVVGRKVLVNNHAMTVIGVAAADFRGIDWGEVPSLWIPTMMKRQATPEFDWLDDRRGRWLHVFGRLTPGVTLEQAQARLQPWFKTTLEEDTRRESWPRVTEEERRSFLASTLELLPASRGRSDLRGSLERPLLVLLAATGFVLLLACLNVANLFLARAFTQRRETALRLALGASGGRIVRDLLVQSLILALVGAAVGLALAPTAAQALLALLPENVALRPVVDGRVLLFTLGAAAATGLLFGLVPAAQARNARPAQALKEESTTVAGHLGLRRALVVGQIALALVLLIGAELFVRTLRNLRAQGPGFATTHLVTFRVDPSRSGYTPRQTKRLMRDLLARVETLPEVQSAGLSAAELLGGGSWNVRLTIEDGRREVTRDVVHCNAVTPGFFGSLGATFLAGRNFDERDTQDLAGSGEVDDLAETFKSAIVNQSLAKRYFGGRSPIGARLGLGGQADTRAGITIVGVVKDFSYRGLRRMDDQAFFPFFEGPVGSGGFYARTRVPSSSAFAAIRAAVHQADPALVASDLRSLDDQLDRALANERLLAILASAFAALAISLAVVGLYGVTSFAVSRRTREIGIRLALGASRRTALWLVLSDTAIMVAAGLAIAVPAVWALGRVIESQLFGVRPVDVPAVAGAAVLVAVVALAGSAVPARRAASVNPVDALRCE